MYTGIVIGGEMDGQFYCSPQRSIRFQKRLSADEAETNWASLKVGEPVSFQEEIFNWRKLPGAREDVDQKIGMWVPIEMADHELWDHIFQVYADHTNHKKNRVI
jgi:hypothetical protein